MGTAIRDGTMDFDLTAPGESVDVVVAEGIMRATRLSLDVAEVYFDDGRATARNESSHADLDPSDPGVYYLARGQNYAFRLGDRTAAFFDATPTGWTIFA